VYEKLIIRETEVCSLQKSVREKQTTNERTEIFSFEKTIYGYPRREKKVD